MSSASALPTSQVGGRKRGHEDDMNNEEASGAIPQPQSKKSRGGNGSTEGSERHGDASPGMAASTKTNANKEKEKQKVKNDKPTTGRKVFHVYRKEIEEATGGVARVKVCMLLNLFSIFSYCTSGSFTGPYPASLSCFDCR